VLPADQSLDVYFDDFMADELGTVERIYDLADQPLDADARAGMASFVEAHPRGRLGTIEYDLEPLGLSADGLRPRLRSYTERFQT